MRSTSSFRPGWLENRVATAHAAVLPERLEGNDPVPPLAAHLDSTLPTSPVTIPTIGLRRAGLVTSMFRRNMPRSRLTSGPLLSCTVNVIL